MKNVFKLAAVAVIASLTLVACKNNQTTEEPVDSTAIEQICEEEMVCDTVAPDTVAVEEPVAAQTTTKKTTKKATPTATLNTENPNASKQTNVDKIQKANAETTGEVKKVNTVKRKSAQN